MLARNFKTAAELDLLDHEFKALWQVVHSFEDGSLPPEKINMHTWCGTEQCIAGWAHAYNNEAFPELKDLHKSFSSGRIEWCNGVEAAAGSYHRLMGRIPATLAKIFAGGIAKGEDAVARLRQYLETGE